MGDEQGVSGMKYGIDSSVSRSSKYTDTNGRNALGGDEDGVPIGRLYNELQPSDAAQDGRNVRLRPQQRSEVLLDRIQESLFGDSEFKFEESIVKNNLDEILMTLVSLRSAETNGKYLMGDLAALFDTHMSPGTIYPQLHGLEDEGILRVQELVRSKEYLVESQKDVVEHISAAKEQHMMLSLFYDAVLEELTQSQ